MADSIEKSKDGAVTRIGKYDVIEVLGQGGMGVVYRAMDRQMRREVAIKTLTFGFSGDSSMLNRFYEEGRILGRMNHPNIVTVYDLGEAEGTPYLVMECVQGEPLDRIIAAGLKMPMADRLRIIEEVCSALGCAHAHKVIHRDVKPANIFVLPDGKAKLLDFGIARSEKRDAASSLTRTGHIIGTVPYMAPERLRGETVDGRSDIFAMGVVLYQMITGQQPFTGSESVLIQKILNEPYPPPTPAGGDCPPALEAILDRALAKDPDERYPTAEEMAADLAAVIADLRQGQIQEMLAETQRLVEAQEYARARVVLHQALRIDSKHAAVREMLAQIQRIFSEKKREERVQQIRQQAEDAISNKQFDQGLLLLESSADLVEENPDLMKLREKARKEKEKQDRVNNYLSQAEAARRRGDYKAAIAAADRALKADKTNPRIAALCTSLAKEAEQAQRTAQARVLLDSARSMIGTRRYDEAIAVLKEAELFDPTNPELPLLFSDASTGLEKIRRRQAITQIEESFAVAASEEQLQQVAMAIQEAINTMPSEPSLLRLNVQVERQLKEHENRRYVEETLQACRDHSPREALEMVQMARRKLPRDEKLLSLEALLTERLHKQTVEERRADYLARAREALGSEQYADAVRLLEFARAEGLATDELLSLLDYARSEEREHRRLDLLHRDITHAESLIAASSFDEAVAFLEEALQRNEDAALRMLHDQATAGGEKLRQQIESTLSSAANLVNSGKQDEAMQFLEMQSREVLRAARVQNVLAVLEDEQHQAVYRTVGRAYAALQTDLPAGDAWIRQTAAAAAVPAFGAPFADAFRSWEREFADQAVTEAVRQCRTLLQEKDKKAVESHLMTVSHAIPFAGTQARAEWKKMGKKSSSTAVITAVRD